MEQAANLEPTNMQVLQSLTQMYMRANRPADAERVAERALTFNANSKDAAENLRLRARRREEVRRSARAVRKRGEARSEGPASARPRGAHLRRCELAGARDAAARPRAGDRPEESRSAGRQSRTRLGAARRQDVDRHVRTDPRPADGQRRRKRPSSIKMALVYAREKQDTRADATFRKAIDNYGNLPRAHLAYGDYLAAKNDKAGALREWTTAVGPNRDNPEALARLGQAAAEGNDFNKAVDNYKRLTEVDTNDPRAYLLLGQAYLAAQEREHARAMRSKRRSTSQHTPDALVGLAAADQQARNFTEAVQIYEALDKNARAARQSESRHLSSAWATAYKGANQPQKSEGRRYVRFLAFLKPGTQGYTQVQQTDRADRSSDRRSRRRKPSPKPSAKPKPKPTERGAEALTTMLVAYDESLTRHLAGVSPHRAARPRARGGRRAGAARPARRAHRYAARRPKRKSRWRTTPPTSSWPSASASGSMPASIDELTTGDTDIDATSYEGALHAAGGALAALEHVTRSAARGVRARAAARSSRRTGARHGLLPVQQRGDRGARVHAPKPARPRSSPTSTITTATARRRWSAAGCRISRRTRCRRIREPASPRDNRVARGGALVNVPLAATRHIDRSVRRDLDVGVARRWPSACGRVS